MAEFVLIVAPLLIVIGFFFLLRFFFLKLKKKGHTKLANGLVFTLVCFIVFETYTAFNPLNSFYKDEFENDLKIHFPASAEILKKDATYPDIHGHYEAAFSMSVSAQDYQSLQRLFPCNISKDSMISTEPYEYALDNISDNKISCYSQKIFGESKFAYLVFINDKKTIIFNTVSM